MKGDGVHILKMGKLRPEKRLKPGKQGTEQIKRKISNANSFQLLKL